MKIADQKLWKKGKANNTSSYGAEIYRYAEAWADLMESRMDGGEVLEDIAGETAHEADTDGITGFMYGAAANILSWGWVHGDRLRRWNNGEYLKNEELEKANEGGGCVNPAVLIVSGLS